MRISFFLEEIDDEYIRENFKKLSDAILAEAVLKGEFKFFSIPVAAAGANLIFKHNLSFVPRDIIMTNVSNGAAVTWIYDSFTSTNLVFTVTAACTIRAFIGTYAEGAIR